jgi:hypothetical protein
LAEPLLQTLHQCNSNSSTLDRHNQCKLLDSSLPNNHSSISRVAGQPTMEGTVAVVQLLARTQTTITIITTIITTTLLVPLFPALRPAIATTFLDLLEITIITIIRMPEPVVQMATTTMDITETQEEL